MTTCWTLDWTMVGAVLALTAPRMVRELVEARTMLQNTVKGRNRSDGDSEP